MLHKKNVVLHETRCSVKKKKKKKKSHISYVAHQNYVSHKKIANCANKKLCDFQKETHVD